jgi:ribose 5-phosphate isomerase B
MKIFVGSDHNGFNLHNQLIDYLRKAGYEVHDSGNTKLDPNDDFTEYAAQVVDDMRHSGDEESRGVLICGSGQGMCMAANRFKGIRAAFGHNESSVKAARNDSDSNVLCLASNDLQDEQANVLVETWLNTPFNGALRFNRRIKAMDDNAD